MNLPYIYIESYVVNNELLKPILRGRKSDLRENQKKKSSCNKKNDEMKVGKSKCSKPEDNLVKAGQENQAVNISVDECNSDLTENQKKKSSCNKKNDELKVGKSKCSKPEDNMVKAGQENQAVNISVDECNSPKRFQKDTILPFKAKSKSSEINRKHKRRSGMLAHVSNLFQMFI